MMYGQLAGCRSLREIEAGFNAQTAHHYHMGTRAIKRSTLADANIKRDVRVFEDVCGHLLQGVHNRAKKELGQMLYLLDSTPIPLCGPGYDDWTANNHSARTRGLKVHMMTAPDAAVPTYLAITPPNINDVKIGRQLALERGATYVFDKGYCDYNWWHQFTQQNAFFVTRFKVNAGIKVTQTERVTSEDNDILSDDIVEFKNKRPGGGRINHHYGTPLRRVMVKRPGKDPLILATNDMSRPASDIARLYKRRWDIELFFKWLKQNLKIKQFLGRSKNAVKLQIYVAIIAYLLAYLCRRKESFTGSMRMYIAAIRTALFQRPETEIEIDRRRRKAKKLTLDLQASLAL
jgi:IS4 transposase